MGILDIQTASLEGAHLLIQLFGGPRSGKTRTALRLARGIVGPAGKIGVLDTESGRARLHAKKIPGGFMVGELTPPYTAERYRLAMEEFIAAGVDIMVVDSFSHIWEGPGGVLEQADANERAGAKGLLKWMKPKVAYKKTIMFLLSTKMHVILCSRGKQPVEERTDDRGKKVYVTLPWEPIQDKNLKYEMTIVLPMLQDGRFETEPHRLKAPDDLEQLFTGEPLTEETGAAISAWLGGATKIDHGGELLRKRANDAAVDGVEAFRAFWKALAAPDRATLKAQLANLQSIAEAADAEAATRRETEAAARREDGGGDLREPFGGAGGDEPAGGKPLGAAADNPAVTGEAPKTEQGWAEYADDVARYLRQATALGDLQARWGSQRLLHVDAMHTGHPDGHAAVLAVMAEMTARLGEAA